MTQHFDHAAQGLKVLILQMIEAVDRAVSGAVRAFSERDGVRAEAVIGGDDEIDQREIDLEEECLKVLALHQPAGRNLRFVISVLKINNDLERIADLATSIARRARAYSALQALPSTLDFPEIARRASIMVRQSLETLVNFDVALARSVITADAEIDRLHRGMYDQVKAAVKSDPTHVDQLFLLLSVSRNLERIADHAANIAWDVVYLIEGSAAARHLRKNV